METSLKTDFAQIFSRCPKNLSCPKFGGPAAPLAPPARTPIFGLMHAWVMECLFLRETGADELDKELTVEENHGCSSRHETVLLHEKYETE